jgi:hypothetical protein
MVDYVVLFVEADPHRVISSCGLLFWLKAAIGPDRIVARCGQAAEKLPSFLT